MPDATPSADRQPCDNCGQPVSTRVVDCPRCGRRVREPAVVPPMARERAEAAAPIGLAGEAEAATPVLNYQPPPPPKAPPAKHESNAPFRVGAGIVLALVFGVRAYFIATRPPAGPAPARNAGAPVNARQRPPMLNQYNQRAYPGQGVGGGSARGYEVDQRGRLVDRHTGEPINPERPGPPGFAEPPGPRGPVGPPSPYGPE